MFSFLQWLIIWITSKTQLFLKISVFWKWQSSSRLLNHDLVPHKYLLNRNTSGKGDRHILGEKSQPIISTDMQWEHSQIHSCLFYFFSSLRSWPLYLLLRQRIDLAILFATQYSLPHYFFALTAVYLPHTLSLTVKIKRIYLPVIRLVAEEYFILEQILWLAFTDFICSSRMTVRSSLSISKYPNAAKEIFSWCSSGNL